MANVRVSAIGEQLDIGLLSMANQAGENDGVRFLRCTIDILSRKLGKKFEKQDSQGSIKSYERHS